MDSLTFARRLQLRGQPRFHTAFQFNPFRGTLRERASYWFPSARQSDSRHGSIVQRPHRVGRLSVEARVPWGREILKVSCQVTHMLGMAVSFLRTSKFGNKSRTVGESRCALRAYSLTNRKDFKTMAVRSLFCTASASAAVSTFVSTVRSSGSLSRAEQRYRDDGGY